MTEIEVELVNFSEREAEEADVKHGVKQKALIINVMLILETIHNISHSDANGHFQDFSCKGSQFVYSTLLETRLSANKSRNVRNVFVPDRKISF